MSLSAGSGVLTDGRAGSLLSRRTDRLPAAAWVAQDHPEITPPSIFQQFRDKTVENVGADLSYVFWLGKLRAFNFGADDCLPPAHLCLSWTSLIVAAARLSGHATKSGYGGNALVAK